MRLFISVLALLMVVTFAACGDDDEEGGATTAPNGGATSPAGGGAEVEVELVDFSVVADSSAPAGEVSFNIKNSGPEHTHEFVVVKTDLDAAELPVADDGSVEEGAEGLDVIGEEIEVGGSETLTVDLDAGHYALICNIVDEHMGETFLHYERGMHRDFTAE